MTTVADIANILPYEDIVADDFDVILCERARIHLAKNFFQTGTPSEARCLIRTKSSKTVHQGYLAWFLTHRETHRDVDSYPDTVGYIDFPLIDMGQQLGIVQAWELELKRAALQQKLKEHEDQMASALLKQVWHWADCYKSK